MIAATSPVDGKKWTPAPRSIEEVTQQLKPEEGCRLDELKLCWREPRTKNDSVSLLTKKNVACLGKAIQKTPSRITHLSIGWKHGGNRKSLMRLLQLFTDYAETPALELVDSVELVLTTWVPDAVLIQMLLTYAPRLRKLHIQATRMKVKAAKSNPFQWKNTYQSVHAGDYVLEEESVAKIFANPKLVNELTSLKSLALVDCDVLDEEVDILVKHLWHRAKTCAVESLSLRSNRHMSAAALQKIAQAPVLKYLDLSLCDISNSGAFSLSRAFAVDNPMGWRQQNSVKLEEFMMSGNYQIDERGFTALCRVVPYQVQHWDMSYCDITDHQSLAILKELVNPLSVLKIPLRELTLRGLKVSNPVACHVIRSILIKNRSLIRMIIDDPKYPVPISVLNLQIIVEGLRYHYSLQELYLDLRPIQVQTMTHEARHAHESLEMYLMLNRAGRKILQNEIEFDKGAWINVLFKARLSGRLDVLYWLLRNSVVYLF